MSALLRPHATATYDAACDRIVVSLRDGRSVAVAEFAPEAVPGLINQLMQARCDAKAEARRRAAPPPPPPVRPRAVPARA